ncbi:hypothetical protein I302_105820 [Kwoniella bestiolae CBS 10118]|uniref:Amidase domain-containing protein n=1 Tax=Kwoniella bestiolae CBS 10118 TaxID=1296100 RepID=A0AAJ8KAI1_9TREE
MMSKDVEKSHSSIQFNNELFYSVGDIEYFSPTHQPAKHLPLPSSVPTEEEYQPICLIWIPIPEDGQLTKHMTRAMVRSYLSEDDVLSKAWLQSIFVIPSYQGDQKDLKLNIQVGAVEYLIEKMGTTHLFLDERFNFNPEDSKGNTHITSMKLSALNRAAGPYLARHSDSQLDFYPVYRLYSDTYHAFINGIYPLDAKGRGRYKTLNKTDGLGRTIIPVPSRLYGWGSGGKLKGYRVSVKDIFDILGVPTGAGSKVYLEMRREVEDTASCIQRLIEQGAVIVGKVKTNQFAVTGNSIEHSPDILYPYSPRGDGYQSVSGTSSGSASSMAGYDWLDISVASDTGGSIRHPASIVGLYGNKPTMGVFPLDGVIPMSEWSDTAGVLARDPGMMKWVLETWYAHSPAIKPHKFLPKIVRIPVEDFQDIPQNIQDLINGFLNSLKDVLGMQLEWIDISQILEKEGNGKILSQHEFANVLEESQYQTWGQDLIDQYKSRNGGRFPPVFSEILQTWKGTHHSPEDLKEMKERWDISAKVFRDLIGRHKSSITQSILIEPINIHRVPIYRESKLNFLREPLSTTKNPLSLIHLSSIAGCPHYVVPIGQVPFKSLVSDQEEMQPLGMSMIGYPGSDFVLLEIIEKLRKAGVLKTVKTGQTAF